MLHYRIDTEFLTLPSKLLSINGVDSREVINRFSKVAPFSENEYSTAVRVAQYIPKAEVLNGLGVIPDTSVTPFLFEINGHKIKPNLTPSPPYYLEKEISFRNNSQFNTVEDIDEDIWFDASGDKRTIYFKFRRYISISKMESLAKDLLSFINKNQWNKGLMLWQSLIKS